MDLTFPLWFEVASIAVIVAVLLVDLALVVRRPHIPTARESSAWIGFYVGLAIVFGIVLIAVGNSADPRGARGYEAGIQFYAGWMTEYSLSADNLFVFLIIMGRFAVPKRMQQELLMAGILLALVFRVIFILLGGGAARQLFVALLRFWRLSRVHRDPTVAQARRAVEQFRQPRHALAPSGVASAS